jgi:hypothetical protein
MLTKKTRGLLAVIALLVFASGCISKSSIKQGDADAKRPINCATAASDIQLLESEKANVGQQIVSGATSIIPIGAVVHVLQLDEGKQLEVGIGEYNRMLDKRIAEIKKECNIK